MSAKKSNVLYVLFLISIIPVIILVFGSFANSRKNKNFTIDYNKIFKIEDYNIKINNAILVTDTNQFYFTFNYKANRSNTEWSIPEIVNVRTGYKNNKDYFIEHEAEFAKYYIAVDMEKQFDFVQINVVTTTPEKQMPDKVDEFGDTIKGEVIEAKRSEQYIRIDYDDIIKLTTDQKMKYSTTKAQNLEPPDEVIETGVVVTTVPTSDADIPSEKTYPSTGSSAPASITSSETASTKITSETTKQTTAPTTERPVTQRTQSYTQPPQTDNTSKNTSKQTTKETTKSTQKDTTLSSKETTKQTTIQTTDDTTKETTKGTIQTSETVSSTSIDIIHVYSIRLETGYAQNNVILSIGNSATVSAVVLPENATDCSVVWKSNRPDIAVVDNKGTITAVSKGKAIISAVTTDGGLQAACMVTVS